MIKTIESKKPWYVIKDQDNNYVTGHSIDYYEDTKQVVYAYSKFLTNGFYHDSTLDGAEERLELLQISQKRFKLNKQFHIEQILDIRAVLQEENKSGEIKHGLSSIQRDYIDFNDSKTYVWIIKDQYGNFAHEKSIRKTEKDTIGYISYKTFSKGCRGYSTLFRAELILDKLKSKTNHKNKNIFDLEFHLEYHDLSELIKEDHAFQGENIVLIETKVA